MQKKDDNIIKNDKYLWQGKERERKSYREMEGELETEGGRVRVREKERERERENKFLKEKLSLIKASPYIRNGYLFSSI